MERGIGVWVHVDRNHLGHVPECKYLGYVLNEASTDEAECSKKVAGAIRSLVNARDLQLECSRVLHETLLVPVLTYGSDTILWKERSRIRAVQMDNIKGLLDIRRMNRVPNGRSCAE